MADISLRDQVSAAKKLFQQHDYEGAETILRKAAKAAPQYADVHNMLGVVYHDAGRFSDAIKAFEAALEQNPGYSEALLNLAVLYNDLGKYKQAKQLYARLHKGSGKAKGSKAIEPVLKGKLSNMHAEIGDIYFGLGLYEPAIDQYERALHLNPMYVDIRTKLGVSQRELGDLKASEATLKDVIKTKASYHNARVQLGVTLYAKGNAAEAKKTWKATLTADPDNAMAKMYLSLCQ